jgi:RNA polymerase sigma factor (TIGR02999 family)
LGGQGYQRPGKHGDENKGNEQSDSVSEDGSPICGIGVQSPFDTLRGRVEHDVQLTELIRRMQRGDRAAGNSLFACAAARLRKMSASLIAKENTAGFQVSDLVQETYLQKIADSRFQRTVQGREHFFSLMALGMRQVLIDRGRKRSARKRQIPKLETTHHARLDPRSMDLAAALRKLEKLDPDSCVILNLKNHHGLTWEEIGHRTGRSVWQVRADYAHALHWLRAQIG